MEMKFKKNDLVVLPANVIRPGSERRGLVLSDYTVQLNGATYLPIEIQFRVTRSRSELPKATIIWVDINDLRLDVKHPACPNCRCMNRDNKEEEDEDEELEELEEEAEEEPFR